ncbi:hypothetical protein [Micromonospora echinaurantiaca]|nr:hypothetical protein [Micromonospora echinaurantiaca]
MRVPQQRRTVEQPAALPMLVVAAVLSVIFSPGRAVGLCIVFRLAKRAVPGCVPAWSADRAPPRRLGIA